MNLPALRYEESGLALTRPDTAATRQVLTPDALAFLQNLVEEFTPSLRELMIEREVRQAAYDSGELPDFEASTLEIRESDWRVAAIPTEVLDRRTEITGPVSRKMVINALNSGARVYMADFEDSTAPSWCNVTEGQVNLMDAVRKTIEFCTPQGKHYALNKETAVLMVRPRGLHLPERHIRFRGKPIPAALMDFGLYLFHNHAELAEQGSRPYFYLPKLQDHAEAKWWNEVIDFAEQRLGLEKGTVRVTVLIETLPAAFQMHEILHALKDRILGLNCGRWDYIFSYIKTLKRHADRVLPDRGQVTMMTPFLRSYSRLLIQTCHQRGAFAMGGMAAQIPIRNDEEANRAALERVQADKRREAADGHDGTWVAHPGLEPLARAEFDQYMPGRNQLDRMLDAIDITADDLLTPCKGTITEAGVRSNIRVSILYLAAWFQGNGCVPIDHLMEDAATAEIGRTQLWQWCNHSAQLDDGREITPQWLDELFDEVSAPLIAMASNGRKNAIERATFLLQEMTQSPQLVDFLTLPAYWQVND